MVEVDFMFNNTVSFFCPQALQTPISAWFLVISILSGDECNHFVLIFISQVTSNIENIFIYLCNILTPFVKYVCIHFAFLIVFSFFNIIFLVLYVFRIVIWLRNSSQNFSHSVYTSVCWLSLPVNRFIIRFYTMCTPLVLFLL